MPTLLIASGNRHKLDEITAIFADCGLDDWQLLGLDAYPHYQAPPEDGDSFRANATIKAVSACCMSGLPTLADDSGLCVDALDGGPGIYSARYAGTGRDADNRLKLRQALDGLPDEQRGAAFVCCACIALPAADEQPRLYYAQGRCPGRIATAEQGQNGFGYDPLFYLPQLACTMAQLEPQVKNRLSHRYQAMRQAAEILKQL